MSDALYAYLARLNEDGHHPELASYDARAICFIATLTDPDADHVHHVVTDEGGFAHTCDDYCQGATYGPCTWRPKYPVISMSQHDPDFVKGLIAKAEREQDEAHEARIARLRATSMADLHGISEPHQPPEQHGADQ